MVSIMLSGSVAAATEVSPEDAMMLEIASCATPNRSVSSSMPLSTAACASTKRTKHLSAISGLRSSVKLPQVLTTPVAKNSTSNA